MDLARRQKSRIALRPMKRSYATCKNWTTCRCRGRRRPSFDRHRRGKNNDATRAVGQRRRLLLQLLLPRDEEVIRHRRRRCRCEPPLPLVTPTTRGVGGGKIISSHRPYERSDGGGGGGGGQHGRQKIAHRPQAQQHHPGIVRRGHRHPPVTCAFGHPPSPPPPPPPPPPPAFVGYYGGGYHCHFPRHDDERHGRGLPLPLYSAFVPPRPDDGLPETMRPVCAVVASARRNGHHHHLRWHNPRDDDRIDSSYQYHRDVGTTTREEGAFSPPRNIAILPSNIDGRTTTAPVAIHRHDPADHQGRPVKVRCGMPPSPEATMTAMDDDDNPMRWRQDKFIFHCKVCGDAYFATFNECAHNERGCTITSSSCTPRRSEDGK